MKMTSIIKTKTGYEIHDDAYNGFDDQFLTVALNKNYQYIDHTEHHEVHDSFNYDGFGGGVESYITMEPEAVDYRRIQNVARGGYLVDGVASYGVLYIDFQEWELKKINERSE